MTTRRLFILFIGILLLVSTVKALDPVNVAVTSSNLWITADNTDSANITVIVTDGTNKAIGDAIITLGVSPPWSLQDSSGTTPAGGQFVTRFLPTTTSGTAAITATVTVPGVTTVPVVKTYSQNIIAGIPAKATNSYAGAASVGSITDITIRVTDQYGNPVTSKKTETTVTFATTSSGDSGFVIPASGGGNGWGWGWGWGKDDKDTVKVKGLPVPLNDTGFASASYALDTHPGDNYVIITPPAPLPPTMISIQSIADLPPSSIEQDISPGGKPPTLPTDGLSKFTINYHLYDKYGNPSTNRNLAISTNAGEKMLITSNNAGAVTITYGPRSYAGRYTITAKSQDNSKVSASQILQFVSGKPKNMLLTASPQTMASLDAKEDAVSLIMSKVIDDNGNPVKGQVVSFRIESVNTAPYAPKTDPSLQGNGKKTSKAGEEVTAVTDEDGMAVVEFFPGGFETDAKKADFSPNAQGTARIRAKWSAVSQYLDLSFKNFPYLSVYTSVNPTTIETNETVDVTIRVKGDGYALEPKPVDAYMVTDRSGSMSTGDPSRMELVKEAATAFKDQFDYSVDRLGQFSFGGDVTFDLALSNQPTQVQNAISFLSPSGYTPMRYALYQAITELKKYKNSDSVKGLVVLSDGDYNEYGDPLARGKGSSTKDYSDCAKDYYKFGGGIKENMSEYARANNIRIYTIGYSDSLTEEGQKTLRILAETTNGKYYYALTHDDLINFYGDIAGALKDTAGVNTTLALDFSSVDVNGNPVTPGSKALEYVYIDDKSTRVTYPNGTWEMFNSTDDMKTGRLNVSMGTIKVNQEWLVDLSLKMNMDGNIRIIGPSSKIYFNDNQGTATSIPAPDTFVTAIPAGTDKGVAHPVLTITNLSRTNPDADRENAVLKWDIAYTGTNETITEEIRMATLNTPFWFVDTTFAGKDDKEDTYTVDISTLAPGTYRAMVTGIVPDAPSSSAVTQFTIPGEAPKPEIVIH
jgi:hypothetical protein